MLDDWQGGTLNLSGLTSPTIEPLFANPAPSIKDRFLNSGGGRIDRAEVRRRACNAMARNLPDFTRCINEASEWAIVGGGPSINDNVDQIRKLKARGVNIVSVNKSHDWLLEHGITPWGHILLDPKEWVAGYVKKPLKTVRYFVASQCHDDTFEALKDFPVFLWHAGQDFPEGAEPNKVLREKWPRAMWHVVPGPTTVGLRALFLGSQLGASHFHLFGMDSSRSSGRLHGYDKPEAPDAEPGTLKLRHKGFKYSFETNSHMARQQFDFDKLIEDMQGHMERGHLPKNFNVTVYGSGLLPFFAAKLGLHANPECNADPVKVGGFTNVEAEPMFGRAA